MDLPALAMRFDLPREYDITANLHTPWRAPRDRPQTRCSYLRRVALTLLSHILLCRPSAQPKLAPRESCLGSLMARPDGRVSDDCEIPWTAPWLELS